MALSLRQLRYFVAVAEEGQVTRAAAKLHLAQPALSQAISQLEGQLGVHLLVRHARGVSLTPAGEALFAKARLALAAITEADLTAQSLARATRSVLELGFLGPSPMLDAPELFTAFAAAHPDVEISFHELPFPRGSTSAWLEEVDVGICFQPTPHPDVEMLAVRTEPRVVLAAKGHPLAQRRELKVADVLDATFCATHPSLEPVRTGFWRLDDHRGGPAPNVTADRAINPFEVAAVVAAGRAIATTPASSAVHALRALTSLVAIPLLDAHPAVLSLVWRKGSENPVVAALVATASGLSEGDADRPRVELS